MQIFITVLLVLSGIIALLLLLALFIKKEHYVKREILIHAPAQKVFDYVKLVKNQENFNRHAMADADRQKTFTGTDGTVGYVYSWSGDKSAGVGQKEIKKIVNGKSVEMEIRFTKPMPAVACMIMETEALSDHQTKVYWSNRSSLKYPLNVMVPMIEKMLAKDMDKSLLNLKDILEK